jgi:uncharacterized membrane protein
MASDALQCPWCHNWRREIHLLIDTYLKFALGQIAGTIISAVCVAGVLLGAKGKSWEEFITTPSFAILVLIVVVTVVLYVVTQVFAVRYRRRIEQATKGLWTRPWWTF